MERFIRATNGFLLGVFVGLAAYFFLGAVFPFGILPLQQWVLSQQTHRDTWEANRVIFLAFVFGSGVTGFTVALLPGRKK